MTARPTPFEVVFSTLAEDRFPEIQASLAEANIDPADRNAFLLDRQVFQLLRDVVPDGVGEAVDQHVALLHNAYLYWNQGSRVVRLSRERAEGMLTDGDRGMQDQPGPWYIQFPERLVWAQLSEGDPHEPLDGFFASQTVPGEFRVLGIFCFHPERSGLSVAEVMGKRPDSKRRETGEPFFAPLLPGGDAAQLYSISGAGELIELGARAMSTVAPAVGGAQPGDVLELA
jgi:hypothetical protein